MTNILRSRVGPLFFEETVKLNIKTFFRKQFIFKECFSRTSKFRNNKEKQLTRISAKFLTNEQQITLPTFVFRRIANAMFYSTNSSRC